MSMKNPDRERVPMSVDVTRIGQHKGENVYYWGGPCKRQVHHKNGKSLRYSSNGSCVYCEKNNHGKRLDIKYHPSKMHRIDKVIESKSESEAINKIYGWDDL